MPLHQTFATNLRQLCDAAPSIAAVCREIGINRQQFNRYLAGSALPNAVNLELICRYFGVAEGDLFQETGTDLEVHRTSAAEQALVQLAREERPASLAPGLYFMTYAGPDRPDILVRATLVIRQEGNLTTFRRLTFFGERSDSWWARFRGDNRGIVVERRSWFYFIGINDTGRRTPSLITLKWAPIETPLLIGNAAIMGTIGPMILPVVVSSCPRHMTLRQALRCSRTYSADDPAIDTVVVDMLDQQTEELIAMVKRLDLSVTPVRPTRPRASATEPRDQGIEAKPRPRIIASSR